MKTLIVALLTCVILYSGQAQIIDSTDYPLYRANQADSCYAAWLTSSAEQEFLHPAILNDNIDGEDILGVPDDTLALRFALLDAQTPLDIRFTPEVKKALHFYLGGKKRHLSTVIGRSGYYFPLFEAALDKHNMPLEIKYLPIIESALNPTATSPAGAKGLWQFMYTTGKLHGLEITSYVDERMDPFKSTDAACRYLLNMYDLFGSWELALAAYNAGPGNVTKAIRLSHGGSTYWEIYPYLPSETRRYVPSLIAMIYCMHFASQHGVQAEMASDTYFSVDTLHAQAPVGLIDIAKTLQLDPELLAFLNPQYKLKHIPGPDTHGKAYAFVIPRQSLASFTALSDSIYSTASARLKKSPLPPIRYDEEPYIRTHTVKSGDTLGAIALKYKVRVSDLQRWNKLKGTTIRVGQKIKVRAS